MDLHELLPKLDGLVVVTIPSAASESAVGRSMSLARERGIPILGVIENMAGYACADCDDIRPLFPGDAGDRLCREHETNLLGRIPFDPDAAGHANLGALDQVLEHTAAGEVIDEVAGRIIEAIR